MKSLDNIFFFLKGEKAYSCLQCGTRFTYRNGLIKHTKLNRCPKKIVTADGETIIKKRSRTVSVKSKLNFSGNRIEAWSDSPPQLSKSPIPELSETRKTNSVDQKLLGSVIRRHSELSQSSVHPEDVPSNPEPQFQLPRVESGPAMTYGMFNATSNENVSSSSTTTTTTTSATTTKVETTHQALVDGVLPDSTVAELSLATGLPESEIRTWATCLPAGSTVKVTHHFDTSMLAKAAAAAVANVSQSTTSSSMTTTTTGNLTKFIIIYKSF